MNATHNRAKSIFLSAAEIASMDERRAFVDAQCAGDDQLRREVDELLRHQQSLGSFLEAPIFPPHCGEGLGEGTIDTPPIAERPGTVIGPYKLLQQIGEGGMGVVFMAEQTEPIHRTVALKIIKPGMDTRQVIARFEAERQALAMMDHPNIARVLHAGTTGDRSNGSEPAADARVGEGEIGRRGEPELDASFQVSPSPPLLVSPSSSARPYFVMELVRGIPITDYCDQNRLTVSQRLALFTEVCHAVQHAHQKGIIHRDLKPTNVLVAEYDDRAVPKVIDFGVAKATAQRLTEHTMFTGFGQIIGTLEYMSPEQAKFNQLDIDTRSDIYSLGVLLYELLTGSTPLERHRLETIAFDETLRIIREEEPPRPSTRLSRSGEPSRTSPAQHLTSLATIAVSRKTEPARLTRLIRGELDWIVMKCLEKDRERRYPTANSLALDLRRYLENEPVEARPPSAYYRFRKFASRNKAALVTVSIVAVSLVLGTVASIWQATLARRAEALAEARLESVQQAHQQVAAEAAKATTISTMLQSMLGWASPSAAKGTNYTVRQMLDDFSSGLGDQLRGQPEAEAAIHATIGNAYRGLQSFDKAEPHLKSALELRINSFGPEHAEVAQSLVDYSWYLYGRGHIVEAERQTRQALAIHRKLKLEDRTAMRILSALQFYLFLQSKFDQAEEFAEESLAIAAKHPGKYSEEATVLHNLAHAAIGQGQPAAAERIARRSVALHRQLHGANHPDTAHCLFILATSLHDQQKFDEADACFREALAIHRKQYDDSQTPVLASLNGLARTLRAKGDQAGLDALRAETRLSSTHPEEWESWFFRGSLLAELGDWDQAASSFAKAAEREADPEHFRYLYYQALLRLAANDQPGYRRACTKLIHEVAESKPGVSPTTAVWACVLAPHSVGDPAAVVALAERALESHKTDPSGPATLAAALYRAGRFADARQLFARVVEGPPHNSNDQRTIVYSQLFLAMIHQQLGQSDEARRWLKLATQSIDGPTVNSERRLAERWEVILPLQLLRKEAEELLGIADEDSTTKPESK